jgi:tetratricopeptide (TPR) repeat protein
MELTVAQPKEPVSFKLGLAIIVLVTAAVYIPVMSGGFVWDDEEYVVANPQVRNPALFSHIWWDSHSATSQYYPLTESALWLGWQVWGRSATCYHVENIALHALVALLLWRVLAAMPAPGAFLAGLVFAIHPVNVASVGWISEMKNTLSSALCLAAMLAYLKFDAGAGKKWYVLCIVAFILGMLAKTAICVMPVLMALCLWWRHGRVRLKDLLLAAPMLAAGVALGMVTIYFEHTYSLVSIGASRPEGMASRIAGMGWALWFYLYKDLLPVGLSAVYPRWRIDGHSVLAFLPLAAMVALVAIAWWYRRGWGRPLFMALACFIVCLLPVLGLIEIAFMQYSLVADHWQYLSVMPIVALACGLGTWAYFRLRGSAAPRLAVAAPVLRYGALVVLLALGVLTARRAGVYHDSISLWTDTAREDPNCWLAWNNLGAVLNELHQCARAEPDLRRAVRLKPDYAYAWNNLGNSLGAQHDSEAIPCFETALRLHQDYIEPRLGLANVYRQLARNEQANSQPARAGADYARARAQLEAALKIDPACTAARLTYGLLFLDEGYNDKAIEQLDGLLRTGNLSAGFGARAHYGLGQALLKSGKSAQAIEHFAQAAKLDPRNPIYRKALDDPRNSVAGYDPGP